MGVLILSNSNSREIEGRVGQNVLLLFSFSFLSHQTWRFHTRNRVWEGFWDFYFWETVHVYVCIVLFTIKRINYTHHVQIVKKKSSTAFAFWGHLYLHIFWGWPPRSSKRERERQIKTQHTFIQHCNNFSCSYAVLNTFIFIGLCSRIVVVVVLSFD